MTTLQLLTALAIFILAGLRPFAFYPCAKRFSSKTSSAFTGVWLVIGILITLPFFHDKLIINNQYFFHDPLTIVFGFIKGSLLWVIINYRQTIRKESNSSSVYYCFISVAIGACINYFFFGAKLSSIQVVAIVAIGFLGLMFFLIGHANKLQKQTKIVFWLSVILLVITMVTDHNAISRTNWYVQFVIANISFFLTSFISRTTKQEWKDALFHKDSIRAGIVFLVGEIVIMSSLVTILPVSVALLCIRLSTPVVMVISAIALKEGKWYEQAAFGGLTLLAALPLIFG